MEAAALNEIKNRLGDWNKNALIFRGLQIILTVIGLLCPLAVAVFADALTTFQVRCLSFAASAAVAVFAAFDVGNLTTRWREAWKHLHTALLDYQNGVIKGDG